MKISVCMATYNGEHYLLKQIYSILNQLSISDELIVVDDCSSDNTIDVIKNLRDERIKIHRNSKNIGHVHSFCKAVSLAKNDYIFLSDQDDIWIEGRVKLMMDSLIKNDVDLLTSNFSWVDANEKQIDVKYDGVDHNNSDKYIKNIFDIFSGKTNYFGCAMLFKKQLISLITPTPKFVESHDLWVALAANIKKSNIHINEKTFLKRKHDLNATSTKSNRPFIKKLYSRIVFILSIFVLYKRKLKLKLS